MKARRVKGLDPEGPLADNLERIVRVRLGELLSFTPRALDPAEVEALHDMRIAAKRLRYILELGGHVFGPYAKAAAKQAKELQDVLGEIHDCDETLPRVEEMLSEQRRLAAAAVRERAGAAEDVDPALVDDAPGKAELEGLHALGIYLEARRALLFERFLAFWSELGREGFGARLEFALSERPAAQGPAAA